MKLAPIVLFVYNRPSHTEQTLNALMNSDLADQSILYIFADGPKENTTGEQLKKIEGVRQLIRAKQWCKEIHIIESDKNKGLANSIIDGVTQIVNEYGKIIVLEDDLIIGRYFLNYMNTALNEYKQQDRVMQISGFNFPLSNIEHTKSAFFICFVSAWGWGTWERSWKRFDSQASGFERLGLDSALSRQFDLNGVFPYTQMIKNQMIYKTIDSWAYDWYCW